MIEFIEAQRDMLIFNAAPSPLEAPVAYVIPIVVWLYGCGVATRDFIRKGE